jgi:hypothetical protein
MTRTTLLFLLSALTAFSTVGVSAPANPIVFVKQAKVDHSGGAIQDLFGNFQGVRPSLDQPVGGGLFLLLTSGEVRALVNGPNIAVRDPEISEDGTHVIFAMKQTGEEKWQIWECKIDGTELRKISRNDHHNDFDPAYLPEGQILFLSDRRRLADPFLNYPSAQMHVMNKNGGGVRLLNANAGGQSNPIPSQFGAILFTEFDYHDRRAAIHQKPDPLAVSRFLPWLVYGDGSGFDHPLFGSHTIRDFKGGYVSVRVVPQTGQLIGILANQKNTFGAGSIVKMDYGQNDDREAPEFITPNVLGREGENTLGRYRDAYPASDGWILASYASGSVYQSKPVLKPSEIPNFKIVRVSSDGSRQEILYEDANFWCWQPVEAVARGPLFIYSGVAVPEFQYAMINSVDVSNRGRNSHRVVNGDRQPAVTRSSIAFVRIFKTERRPNGNAAISNYSDSRPVLLGEAPVFPDGSFAALVPIDTPLIWELVNKKGKVVVKERFGTVLKGGEIRTCYGCHAPHNGKTGNVINIALPLATNLTPYDPDTNGNGVLDILEVFHVLEATPPTR